ncbi:MAG: hypothetical protein ACYCSO_09480 [Cuniculiplasma sp.]|nr:MAG: hypothetical protein AMDU5_GPLC00019G0002 [Thermoplasmatales archaeon Gpl]
MTKISFKYYGKKKLGLLIIGVFAMAGLIFSFLSPKLIYPGEPHSRYIAQVQFLLPIIEVIFFIIGIMISLRIRSGDYPKMIKNNNSSFSTVNTEIMGSNDDGEKPHEVDSTLVLENKLNFYRNAANTDPLKLPDLAKRLLTLSLMYKNKDQKKSRQYAEEAKSIFSLPNYPNNKEGEETRSFGNRILGHEEE